MADAPHSNDECRAAGLPFDQWCEFCWKAAVVAHDAAAGLPGFSPIELAPPSIEPAPTVQEAIMHVNRLFRDGAITEEQRNGYAYYIQTHSVYGGIGCCPTLNVPDTAWRPLGPEGDPTAKLGTTVIIAGLHMHLEAWAVVDDDMGTQVLDGGEENLMDLDSLYSMVEPGEAFQTVTLTAVQGRQYVLLAYPHS